MYILRPRAAEILYAPPFYTPPTPRRVFSGVGGWGCIKIGPVFVDSPGAQTLVFAALSPFLAATLRASITRTPFCAIP